MKDFFGDYHPIINFLYFGLVLLFSMCFMNPICLAVSLISSFAYSVILKSKKSVLQSLLFMLPMMLMAAIVNPAFNHEGATMLTYLPSGNPLTLESIIYGLAASAMLISVLIWFSNFNEVITSDKFVYVLGRIIPALSLILSMTLRFVPKFTQHIKVVSDAQKCIGRDVSNGGIITRAKNGIRILSIMITWSLENAIESADSMRSRGYGLPGRSAFSIYRFDERDRNMMLWLFFCGAYIISGWAAKGLYFRYYPTIKSVTIGIFPISFFMVYFALCITPVAINIKENHNWKLSESKI